MKKISFFLKSGATAHAHALAQEYSDICAQGEESIKGHYVASLPPCLTAQPGHSIQPNP